MTDDDQLPVRYAVDDGIALVTLSRPEARNAIGPDLLRGLLVALDRAATERPRALVLTGEGSVFCAGADLRQSAELLTRDDDWKAMWAFNADGNRVIRAVRDLPCVSVAAVNGAAVGAGIGYALAADFRVFARSAQLVPRFAGLRVTPDNGSSYFLTHSIGAAKAARFFLRDQPMSADEALAFEIADQVVDDADVVSAATALADELSELTESSLRGIRTLTTAATSHGIAEHLELEAQMASRAWPDFREQAEAFFQRPRSSR